MFSLFSAPLFREPWRSRRILLASPPTIGPITVPLGAPSLGGPIVTAGGLVFIAGTIIDPSLRAFGVQTGKEIWKAQLPTSGGATPMTYQSRKSGKQFLVIAAVGHRGVTEEPQSDSIIAFTLP